MYPSNHDYEQTNLEVLGVTNFIARSGLETTRVIPAGGGNSWWIELLPGKSLTYNLRRMAGDRSFTFRFDLTKPVAAPAAPPWGWKE